MNTVIELQRELIHLAVASAAEHTGRTPEDICGASQDREVVEARCFTTAVCMDKGVQAREVARYLNKSDGSVHHYKVLHRNMMETNTKYKVEFSTFTALFISNLGRVNQEHWLQFQKQMQELSKEFPNQAEFIHALYYYLQTQKGEFATFDQ